jgi:hypothetical protein
MARIQVVPPGKTRASLLPEGCSGNAEVAHCVDAGRFPLELHQLSLTGGESLHLGPIARERIGYVWQGAAHAGGHALAAGSSFVVERGEALGVAAAAQGCVVLLFAGREAASNAGAGGHVHLLPNERVPRNPALTESGVRGGMHADAQCPTCSVWLHENGFPGAEPVSAEELQVGVHSHSEDEIIFIVAGQIRLGRKLFPAGTAIAIPGETMYAFTAGPEGMAFVNFRAARPSDIRFADGTTMDEVEYWRGKLPRPVYLEPV